MLWLAADAEPLPERVELLDVSPGAVLAAAVEDVDLAELDDADDHYALIAIPYTLAKPSPIALDLRSRASSAATVPTNCLRC